MKRLIIMVLMLSPVAYAGDGGPRARDWTVEHPLLAGFLSGLTAGAPRFAFAGASREASQYDPFAVSPLVMRELARLSRLPYVIGEAFGFFCTLFFVFGIFFRHLNRLLPKEKQA